MHAGADTGGLIPQQLTQARADRIGKGHVPDDAVPEKGMVLTAAGAVKELVRQQHITRRVGFLQAAHGGDRDDPAHIERAQCPDVRPVIQLGGQDAVALAVSGQKVHATSGQLASHQSIRGRAKGCLHADLFTPLETLQIV